MLRTVVALALLVVLMGVTGARQADAGGTLFLVDTISDDGTLIPGCVDNIPDGDCSLRGAIILANNTGASNDQIVFAIGSGVPTIQPLSQLPDITAPVTMNGATGGATRINIYGNIALAFGSDGLRLTNHTGSTIKNMVINGWSSGAGIFIRGGGDHKIAGSFFGTNYDGTTFFPNSNGVELDDTTGNLIGGAGADANLMSGNSIEGIFLDEGANDNTVVGNTIGLTLDQSAVLANANNGIAVDGIRNQIGQSSPPGFGNVIGGNFGAGAVILGEDNRLQANTIGVNMAGQAFGNGSHGVFVGASTGVPNTIGGSLENGNVISGNVGSGVNINQGANVDVSGNVIGLDRFSTIAVPNQGDGVRVTDPNAFTTAGASGIQIGKPGAHNTIAGNEGDGIRILDVDNVSIRANFIGITPDGTEGFANGIYGINVAADDSIIGGPSPIDGNFIAGHAEAGIFIDGRDGDAEGNEIQNNFIGGVPDVAGNGNGIEVIADQTDIVDNTIVDNNVDGIILNGDSNRLSGNFIGTNSDGDFASNGGNGVTISGDGNLISPDAVASALPAGGLVFPIGTNVIWNNGGSGVVVAEGTGNTIRQNSMKDNFAGAIDLAPAGPTPNDTDDPDGGANDLQNHPVLTLAAQSLNPQGGVGANGGGGILQGTLNSIPNTDVVIDVYTQESCNELANLQPAEEWIGSFEVTTDANGDAEFSRQGFTDMEPGAFVNATATGDLGSTSELSPCIEVTGSVVTPTPSPTPSASPTSTPGPTRTPTPTPSPTDVYGDADCDGDVDEADAFAVLTEVADIPPGAPCSSNVGCEDPIDVQDALDIMKFVASPANFPLPLC